MLTVIQYGIDPPMPIVCMVVMHDRETDVTILPSLITKKKFFLGLYSCPIGGSPCQN
jgi:hypothetical protein